MPANLETPSHAALYLLSQFIRAEDPEHAQKFLCSLLEEHTIPLIRKVIQFKLTFGGVSHRSHELQNEDDLCQDVVLQLIRHLESLRQSRDLYAIMNFEGYVARCAQNAYSSYVRSKNPIRWRFKNRVRYFLNHQLEVEMWEHNPGQMVCGFPDWRHRTPPPADNHVASRILDGGPCWRS